MWYVEARIGETYERWEGLTQEQSKSVRLKYYNEGFGFVRSGRMDVQ
jgi:hypothetical protein